MKMIVQSSVFQFVIIERRCFPVLFQFSYRDFILQKGPLRLKTLDDFVPLGHNENTLRIGISESSKSLLSGNIALGCEQFFSDYSCYLVVCSGRANVNKLSLYGSLFLPPKASGKIAPAPIRS